MEVPAKREMPKKEVKKIRSVHKVESVTKTKSAKLRRKKSYSLSSDNESKYKKSISPAASEEASIEKKKEEMTSKLPEKSVAMKTANSPKTFNMELAKKFFEMRMKESQRTSRMATKSDSSLETMPESSHNSGQSSKSRKSQRTRGKSTPLDRNIFKENGEPVWVVPDRKPGELVMNEHGEMVKYPELMAALEEDGLEMEDGKGWFQKMSSYLMGELDQGRIDNKAASKDINPFASMETLEERTDLYFSRETVIYNTTDSIFNLCHNAIERFSQQNNEDTIRKSVPPSREPGSKMMTVSKDEEEKTAIVTSIRFDARAYRISYDRRRPVHSIQKFRKKYQKQLKKSQEEKKDDTKTAKNEGD